MIVLQQRDRRILQLCYEQQFLLREHVERLFPNASYRACCQRIRELVCHQFLRVELGLTMGKMPIYRVTRLGEKVALEAGSPRIVPLRNLHPALLQHDSVVTSVRQRLEEVWSARFICERAIKGKEYRQIPDGIFFFNSGKGIAIEIENSDKGKSRFVSLLERWPEVPQIVFVLFVVTQGGLYRSIQRYLQEAPQGQPMGCIFWEELKKGTPHVWTPRGELDLFQRREF